MELSLLIDQFIKVPTDSVCAWFANQKHEQLLFIQ